MHPWMHRVLMSSDHQNEKLMVDSLRKKYTTQRTLRNGVTVTFRPIECTDQELFKDFFKSLSAASVHYRFFEILKELPNDMVERYCNLDPNQEIAIVAEPKNDRSMIATARLIFNWNKMQGEFTLTVSDAWQGVGLGVELLNYIIKIALDFGLVEIHCFVSCDNLKMIGLSEKMGFIIKSTDGDTLKMSLRLDRFGSVPIA